ncbi:hypothetical protein L1887_61759 [Cichorium endivia]|nr:hypothetical protein L1887_61759 [Cichorium endivia]
MSAAPPGRVQAPAGFDPASYGSVLPGTSYLERTRLQNGSIASTNDEPHLDGDHDEGGSQRTWTDDQDGSWNGDAESSILSDFASIFHPNEYIVAQQRLDDLERRSDIESFDEESMPILPPSLLDDREGQQETHPIGALEIVGVECFIIWIGSMLAMLLAKTEYPLLGPPGARMLLLFRGMFGFASTLALYISLHALSLSDATVITFLSPLATGFLAHILLQEPFTLRERVAGIFSLAGVTLIARPSFLFGNTAGQGAPEDGDIDLPSPGSTSEAARFVGILVALSGVVFMAGAWVCLRRIGKKASTYHSISYFALCSWVSSFAAMRALNEPFVIPTSKVSLVLLLGVGLFSLLAQVFQTLGLQRESAGRAATMSYLQIIFALAWQLMLFGSVPDWVSIAGSLVILASGAWVALSKEGAAPMH